MSNNKILLALLFACSQAFANKQAEVYYSSVERHLRSLPSLEIGYRATGSDFPKSGLEGRLVFLRPNRFFHDTPEWTHCENGEEQWRFLKEQQTVMLEDAVGLSDWSPEAVLLSLNRDLVPFDLRSTENGDTVLILDALSEQMSGQVEMIFGSGKRVPMEILYVDDSGSNISRYEILMWHESVQIDSELFLPPEVPADNKIDFRTK